MVILITGASHTGKTLLAQRLVDACHFSCLSIDLLKMGLIRSGQTDLTPVDDDRLTDYLWPIVREIIKTAIENQQDLIVEGSSVALDGGRNIERRYRAAIRFCCLVMSKGYLAQHFEDVRRHACAIEQRLDDACALSDLQKDNARFARMCHTHGYPCLLIEDNYLQTLDRGIAALLKTE